MRTVIKIGLTIILLQFAYTNIYAQSIISADGKALFKADKAFYISDYITALKLYDALYLKDSTDNDMNYKIALCNYGLKNRKLNSIKYFEKLPISYFPEADYYLGNLYHLTRRFGKAIFHFNRYKTNKKKEHSLKEVDDLIEKCNTAILFESTADTRTQISNMGSSINSSYDDYAPLIPAEENFMLFTSRRENNVWKKKDYFGEYFEDIYIAKNDSLGWHDAVMFDTVFNTAVHDAGTGLSADGERLLIYRTSENYISGDIYESYFEDGKWSRPFLLGETVNKPKSVESSACYSEQGDIIFFSSDRAGGFGGKDIYMAKKLPNGRWGKPFNLGPTINTQYNEDAPFIHPLGNTLFFSSQGHKNMGGYDIFKADFNELNKFSEPQNLGYPINTVDDDIFFVLNPEGSDGYLSSGREGGLGGQDIYKVTFESFKTPLNVYNFYVLDESNNVIKEVVIEVVDLNNKILYGSYKSNEHTGKTLFITETNKEYQLTIKAAGYETFVTNVVFYDFNREKLFTLKKKE